MGVKLKSVTSKEEFRLKLFDKKVVTRIFGLRRAGVTSGCRKLLNKQLHDVHALLTK
jgi:hypothetical protein